MSAVSAFGGTIARLAALPSWVVGLVVGLAGVALAWWYYSATFAWWHVGVFATLTGILLLLAALGERRLPESPIEAVNMIGFRTAATLLMAAFGAAIVIVIAVELTTPEGATDQLEQLLAGVSTALTAAVTSSLVDASEAIDGPAASRAERAFKAAYDRKFASNSNGHLAVFSNIWRGNEGWKYGVREKRASEVKSALDAKNKTGDPGSVRALDPE